MVRIISIQRPVFNGYYFINWQMHFIDLCICTFVSDPVCVERERERVWNTNLLISSHVSNFEILSPPLINLITSRKPPHTHLPSYPTNIKIPTTPSFISHHLRFLSFQHFITYLPIFLLLIFPSIFWCIKITRYCPVAFIVPFLS